MKAVIERIMERANECYIIASEAKGPKAAEAAAALEQAQEAALLAYQVGESKLYWKEVRAAKNGEMTRLLTEALVNSRAAWEEALRLRG